MQNIEKEELNEIYEMLNDYELLRIEKRNGTHNETFYSDGIVTYNRNDYDIGFSRTFADDVVTEDFLTFAEMKDNTVVLHCGDASYEIFPVRKKSVETEDFSLFGTLNLDDFINAALIDEEYVSVENGRIYAPVSLYKMGNLTRKQKVSIKRVIDSILDGAQVRYQCCRVPAFSVEFDSSEIKLYVHIYDYANRRYINGRLIYDSENNLGRITSYHTYAGLLREIAIQHKK